MPATAVTPTGVRDGDPDALAALCSARGDAVLAYCHKVAGNAAAATAAAEAFGHFRAAVVATADLAALNPEAMLVEATRQAAAHHADGPAGGVCADVPGLLAARANRSISTGDRERLERHLETCWACRAPVARFRAAERAYRDPPGTPVPANVADTIVAALAAAAPRRGQESEPPPVPASRRPAASNGTHQLHSTEHMPAVADDTETAVADDTDTSIADGTATSIADGTATSIADGTATSIADGTETAITDGTATAITDGTATSITDGTATSITDGTATAIADDTETHARDHATERRPPDDEPYYPRSIRLQQQQQRNNGSRGDHRSFVASAIAWLGLRPDGEEKLSWPTRAAAGEARLVVGTQLPRPQRRPEHGPPSPRADDAMRPAVLLPLALIATALIAALLVAGVFSGSDPISGPQRALPALDSQSTVTTPKIVVVPNAREASAAAVELAKRRARAKRRREAQVASQPAVAEAPAPASPPAASAPAIAGTAPPAPAPPPPPPPPVVDNASKPARSKGSGSPRVGTKNGATGTDQLPTKDTSTVPELAPPDDTTLPPG